jgi:FixJ family two-component response regulator
MLTWRRLVAVVEDDPDMRKGLQRVLNVHGFDTEVFPSAEAFLAANAKTEAVCLILDIHLGGMSGIELRRRLSASDCKLPIIFITAVDDDVIEREAMETGCVAYLHKPFPANLLIGAIDKAAG